jgi:RNA polymerase sigma-70 factor, ECF subfamily
VREQLAEQTGQSGAILPEPRSRMRIIAAFGELGMRNSQPESPVSSISERLPGSEVRAAFSQLLESLRPDLLRFAHWLARDRAIAEDIVQESLLRAWRSRDSLKDSGAARAWLLTIVRREHARLYERKRLELVSLEEVAETHAGPRVAQPDGDLFTLRHAIMRLPIEYREPLVLQVLGGFSTEEIARELALSPTAVLTRLFRARNKLRVICGMAAAPDVTGGEALS